MNIKKQIKMLCIVVVVSMIAGTFVGCQTNTEGGISKETPGTTSEETTSFDNNENVESTGNQLQATPMDACLNVDLGMFTLYGKPLGDWTYEELCDYIYANFEKNHESDNTINGVNVKTRIFFNPLNNATATITEEISSINITADKVTYGMITNEWCRSLWTLTSYNPDSSDMVSSICGQRVENYLESICPGLYAKLQEEQTILLKDGLAMMDSLNNGVQRISLCVIGGNLELVYQEGIITSLTVLFTEQ